MADSKNTVDFVAASLEALDHYEASQKTLVEDGERLPTPGDVYVLEATRVLEVEWVIVAHDPADASRFLVVPADSHVLVGSADVELDDDVSLGALKLRCRFGTWIDATHLRPHLRVGTLEPEDLARARQRWLDIGDGKLSGDVLSLEVDDDPGYQDWVDDVLVTARQTLIDAQSPRKAVDVAESTAEPKARQSVSSFQKLQSSIFFRIAASIAVVATSTQLWRLNGQVQDLEFASRRWEERHGVAVQRFDTERERLTSERDRLATERESLLESQDALVAEGVEKERRASVLQKRVDTLDRRLVEAENASKVVNPGIVLLSPPEEAERGIENVLVAPGQSHIVVILPLPGRSTTSKYSMEIVRKEDDALVWSSSSLSIQEPSEIRAGLPTSALRRGSYDLVLLLLEEDSSYLVVSYRLFITEDLAP